MKYCSLCILGLLLFCLSPLKAQTGFDWPVNPDSSSHQIGNSYGQLQAYEGSEWYMHTGLDVMVAPGTPVYAVTAGYVKTILTTGGEPYWRVVIGDEPGTDACEGFMYAHVDSASMFDEAGLSVGCYVETGQFLGRVVDFPVSYDSTIVFNHLHFSKIYSTNWANFGTWEYCANPSDYLIANADEDAPVFENAWGDQLLGLRSTMSIAYYDADAPLSGNVDIIARVSDIANHPDWKVAPNRVEYRLEGPTSTDWINSVCFSTSLGTYGSSQQAAVDAIYQGDPICQSQADYYTRDYYFNVTNTDGDSILELSDRNNYLSTTDFLNGTYTVYILATDCSGNASIASMDIHIANFFSLYGTVGYDDGTTADSGIIVTVQSTGQADTTDFLGRFSFSPLGGGPQVFQIRQDGCWPLDTTILVNDDLMAGLTLQKIDFLCGDADDDAALTTADVDYLHQYLFAAGPEPIPFDAGDADACGGINLSDIVFLNRHLLQAGPAPCEEYVNCLLPTGDNRVTLGCPVEVITTEGDSVAVPASLTTDIPISGLTLGLDCGSGDAVVSSVDFSGSVLGGVFDTLSAVIDAGENTVFVYGYSITDSLSPQVEGLLATLWLQIPAEAADQSIDVGTLFIEPGGEFIFSAASGGTIHPAFVDCGTGDIIISVPIIYGDANGDTAVDVGDAVYIINYVFKSGPPPDPIRAGDANCDDACDVGDAVYLINYAFKQGPAPGCP